MNSEEAYRLAQQTGRPLFPGPISPVAMGPITSESQRANWKVPGGGWGPIDENILQRQTQAASPAAGAGMANSGAFDIGAAYDQSVEKYKAALDAAYASTKADNNAQAGKLAQQYNAARGQTYAQARLSAIGNNEQLAAMGLAGNLYDSARSGMSETSRISADVGMRNDINSFTRQESAARDDLALQLIKAGHARDEEYARYLAETLITKANAQYKAQQDAIANNLAAQQAAFENDLAMQKFLASQQRATSSRGGGGGSGGGTKAPTSAAKNAYNAVLYDTLALAGMPGKGVGAAAAAAEDAYKTGLITPGQYGELQKKLAQDYAIASKPNAHKTKAERLEY